jgi:hypothetical protein
LRLIPFKMPCRFVVVIPVLAQEPEDCVSIFAGLYIQLFIAVGPIRIGWRPRAVVVPDVRRACTAGVFPLRFGREVKNLAGDWRAARYSRTELTDQTCGIDACT